MDGESFDIKQDRLQRLKELFPELFAENQPDWEKLKAAFGDDINFANERYVLNWAGKSDAFRVLQQLDAFTNPIRPGAEKQNMLYELMLKAGYELTSPVQYVTQNHPSPQSSPAEGRGGLRVQSSPSKERGELRVPSTLAGEG